VLRIESPKEDQADSAILELVDGPRDMRFALVARTLAYRMRNKLPLNDLTKLNVKKVTQFRQDGAQQLKELTEKFSRLGDFKGELPKKKIVYPDPMRSFPREQRMERLKKMQNESPWW
jgi:large subunit ribosomal protein L17